MIDNIKFNLFSIGDSYLLGVDGNSEDGRPEYLVNLQYYQDWIQYIVGKDNVCIKK